MKNKKKKGFTMVEVLIAIVILAWKMIVAGISPDKRNEVKDNLMRLFFRSSCYWNCTNFC